MKRSFFTFLLICFSIMLYGQPKQETLENVKNMYPSLFSDTSVVKETYNNQICYIYKGNAEQLFSGEMAEPESELYNEAELDAQANLYAYLTKNDKNLEVKMKNKKLLLNYKEDKIYGKIFFVPVECVSVNKVREIETQAKIDKQLSNTNNQIAPLEKSTENVTRINVQENGSNAESMKRTSPSGENNRVCSQVVLTNAHKKEISKIIKEVPTTNDINQTIFSYLKLARKSVRKNDVIMAQMAYREAILTITQYKSVDKLVAYETIMEAADFETANGDNAMALKYYRLFLKCNHLRNWQLSQYSSEINHLISLQLAKI